MINNILIVDDNNVSLLIYKALILKEAFAKHIHFYTSVELGLDYIKTLEKENTLELPEVILLDINMPTKDGWYFISEFEKFPETVRRMSEIFILTSLDISDIPSIVSGIYKKPLNEDILKNIGQKIRQKVI